MPHSSIAVANEFLKLSEKDGVPVSPMKLQKLLYYAQGWHLGFKDSPLIHEQVECWAYGPVFRTLYQATKRFGSGTVQGPPLLISGHRTKDMECDDDDASLQLVRKVWESYKQYSAIHLSNMTHADDSPWKKVRDEFKAYEPPAGTDIPMEYIKDHFKNLAKQGQS